MRHIKHTIPLRVDGLPTRREVVKVSSWRERLVWWLRLLVTGGLRKQDCGLWLTSCHSVIGLSNSLDVVFLRPDGTVLKVVPRLQPWRGATCDRAGSLLALRPGSAAKLGLRPGVALDLQV